MTKEEFLDLLDYPIERRVAAIWECAVAAGLNTKPRFNVIFGGDEIVAGIFDSVTVPMAWKRHTFAIVDALMPYGRCCTSYYLQENGTLGDVNIVCESWWGPMFRYRRRSI